MIGLLEIAGGLGLKRQGRGYGGRCPALRLSRLRGIGT